MGEEPIERGSGSKILLSVTAKAPFGPLITDKVKCCLTYLKMRQEQPCADLMSA